MNLFEMLGRLPWVDAKLHKEGIALQRSLSRAVSNGSLKIADEPLKVLRDDDSVFFNIGSVEIRNHRISVIHHRVYVFSGMDFHGEKTGFHLWARRVMLPGEDGILTGRDWNAWINDVGQKVAQADAGSILDLNNALNAAQAEYQKLRSIAGYGSSAQFGSSANPLRQHYHMSLAGAATSAVELVKS